MNFWKGWTRLLEMVPCYWHVDHCWSTQTTLLLWNMNHFLGKFQHCLQAMIQKYHIAQNFWGRKHSRILQFWSHLWKFSLQNLGVLYPPMIDFSIWRKFSSWNGHFLPICETFLPQKFPARWYSMGCGWVGAWLPVLYYSEPCWGGGGMAGKQW